MAVSGTLGSLLQGVSQQPAHIRNDGQVTEQINMVSDVVRGLTSRPGSDLSGFNTTSTPGLTYRTVSIGGSRYQVGYKAGVLEVLDSSGAAMTVNPDPGTLSYIGAAMEVYVYDGVAYILNRDKVAAMDASTAASAALVAKDEGLVTSLGGEFSHTYEINLEYTDGSVATGTYTAPNGSTSGDAAKTAADYIANQLKISLAAHANIKAGTVVSVTGPVVRISGAPDLKITTNDGSGGTLLRSQTNTAKSIKELAPYAAHGTLVRIVGVTGDEDDFWMRFEVSGGTVGSSFGSDGIWREWFNAFEKNALDLSTMPHVLSETAPGVFKLAQGGWAGRRVGDSTTNPDPSFIGKTIRDINGFQSRLVFIAGPHVLMSRTDLSTDFFKESATVEAASDPIDVMSTAELEFNLEWIVPFDRDLIIFANRSQFIVTGGSAITPKNASLVQTTNFEMGNGARPASTGRTLLFPFRNGGFAGVKEFFSSFGTDASDAMSITQVQDEYMQGEITRLTASTNFSFVVVQTNEPTESKTLFVHQYYYAGKEKQQASWSRWDFPFAVENVFFAGSKLYVLMYDSVHGYVQTSLDLDIPRHTETGYPVSLDLVQTHVTAGITGTFTVTDYGVTTVVESGTVTGSFSYVDLPYNNARLVQGTGCAVPGQVVHPDVVDLGGGVWRYLVSDVTVPAGATIVSGLVFTSLVKPTMPFIRDKNGKVIKTTKLVIANFVIYFDESGSIDAVMSSKYRLTDMTQSNDHIVVANDPNDPTGKGVRSGEFVVQWGERSDWSELTVRSDDFRPMTILELEWYGQTLTRGRRI